MQNLKAKELKDEIRWLSDADQVRKWWTMEHSATDFGYDIPEYYSVLFDDLKILDVESIPELSDYEKIIILEFARALKLAAGKDRVLYDRNRFLDDPHFKIAQKIASLL